MRNFIKVILCSVVVLMELEGYAGHIVREKGWELNAKARVSSRYFETENKEDMVYNGYLREQYRPLIVSKNVQCNIVTLILRKRQF